jgi:hypothetical protein
MRLLVTRRVRDEGTVVVLAGLDVDAVDGVEYQFEVEPRDARRLVDAIEGDIVVVVEVEDWQLLGVAR